MAVRRLAPDVARRPPLSTWNYSEGFLLLSRSDEILCFRARRRRRFASPLRSARVLRALLSLAMSIKILLALGLCSAAAAEVRAPRHSPPPPVPTAPHATSVVPATHNLHTSLRPTPHPQANPAAPTSNQMPTPEQEGRSLAAANEYYFVSKKNTKCPDDAEQVQPNKYDKQDCKNGGKEADSALDDMLLCKDISSYCSGKPYGCYMSDQNERT